MSNVIYADQATFEKAVLQSDVPVLVDFWAEWCPPCKLLAPTLDELSKDYEGKFRIVKINVDENQGFSTQFGFRSIPTMIFFKNGEKVDMTAGNLPKAQIAAIMDKHL